MIKAFFKWIAIGFIVSILVEAGLKAILPFPEFAVIAAQATLVFFIILGLVQIKILLRPPSEDANPNFLERIVLYVNFMLNSFTSSFKSGKESVGGADTSSGIVDSSTKSNKSAAVQTARSQLKANNYYESILNDIRKYEDNIAELKTKVDDAKRFREKCLPFTDSVNRSLVEKYNEEIVKFDSEIREIEKKVHELVLRKRQEEDRAKREIDQKNW
jgi:hypothetical protein